MLIAVAGLPALSLLDGNCVCCVSRVQSNFTSGCNSIFCVSLTPIQPSSLIVQSNRPVHLSSPLVRSNRPVQSSSPIVQSNHPVQSSSPIVQSNHPVQLYTCPLITEVMTGSFQAFSSGIHCVQVEHTVFCVLFKYARLPSIRAPE